MIDPAATKIEREFKHTSPLVGCRFDPAGRFLFVSAQDNTIQRFDLLTGAKTTFAGHTSWVRGMAFVGRHTTDIEFVAQEDRIAAADSRNAVRAAVGAGVVDPPAPRPQPFTLVSADYHGNLIWWPGAADDPKPVRTVHAHDGWVRAVAVSPDLRWIATGGNDNAVKIWSTAERKLVRTLAGHASHVYNVAFHPGGGRLVSCDLHGIVKDWDVKTGACTRELDAKVLHKYDTGFMADIGGARAMAFDPGGKRLACAGITNVSNAFAGVGNPLVVVFDWKAGTAKPLKPKEGFQGTMWGVGFHPAGYVIGAGGGSGGRLWFWKGDEPISSHAVTVRAHVRDLALHPSGRRLAVAGGNGTAFIYSLAPGKG